MPRKYPSNQIDIIAKPDVQPLKDVPQYLTLKKNKESFIKLPIHDTVTNEIEWFYFSEKLEHKNQLELLKELQKHKKLQAEINSRRTKKIEKDLDDLRNHFSRMNDFFREYDEKEKSSKKEIQNEIEKQTKLTNEINLKLVKRDDLIIFKKELLATANEYRIYEDVLEDVVELMKCRSMNGLIMRCEALMLSQDEITEENDNKIKGFQDMYKRISDILKNGKTLCELLRIEMNQNGRAMLEAKERCVYWENVLLKVQNAIIEKNLQKQIAYNNIENLYRILCKRRHKPVTFERKNIMQSLEFIKDEVELMQEVIEEYNNPTK